MTTAFVITQSADAANLFESHFKKIDADAESRKYVADFIAGSISTDSPVSLLLIKQFGAFILRLRQHQTGAMIAPRN